jgi:hypothetical protein
MSKLPNDLRTYLEAVREANDRIVTTKKRQLDPKLQDDDLPWLQTENDQLNSQIIGYAFKPTKDYPEPPEDALSDAEINDLIGKLVIPHGTSWETWQDVFDSAEKMNEAIDKVLK